MEILDLAAHKLNAQITLTLTPGISHIHTEILKHVLQDK